MITVAPSMRNTTSERSRILSRERIVLSLCPMIVSRAVAAIRAASEATKTRSTF